MNSRALPPTDDWAILVALLAKYQCVEAHLTIGDDSLSFSGSADDGTREFVGPSPPRRFSIARTQAVVRSDQQDGAERSADTAQETSGDERLDIIRAPMVGTFYRAPAPNSPPFVAEGQIVEPDTPIGIIEVMKVMNTIPAGRAGRVVRYLAVNAELVEFDQPLLEIELLG